MDSLLISDVASSDIIFDLLKEFKEQRDALKLMVIELEEVKININKIFPEKMDARNIRFLEEKIKSATSLFSSLLDVRKEITKTVKEEIELRRKIDLGLKDDEGSFENLLDIRKIAKQIKNLNTEKLEN